MFGKRSPPNPGANAPGSEIERRAAEALERARAEKAGAVSQKVGTAGPDEPRRSRTYAATAANAPRTRMGLPGTSPASEGRKLVVGRDISLSGEIKACEKLVVEGRVAADLKGCKILQISASGLYEGAAEVERAEISGRFEGELTVTGTVTLRATGRVTGRLRYGEMEIERGGRVKGTLEDMPVSGDEAERGKATPKVPAARSTARSKDRPVRPDSAETTTA